MSVCFLLIGLLAGDIVKDVEALRCSGNPDALVAWGTAEPLVVGPGGEVFAAATELAQGRIVALGHGSLVRFDHPDTHRFTANALQWLARDRTSLRMYGVDQPVLDLLRARGIDCTLVTSSLKELALDELDVLVASPQAFAKAGRLDALREWIRGGGGLLLLETAWGVLQLNPDLTLETLAAQQLLSETDLRFVGQAHSGYGPNGSYPIDTQRTPLGNASHAFRVLTQSSQADRALAARVLGAALAHAPLDGELVRAALNHQRALSRKLDPRYRALRERPLKVADEPLACALLDLDDRLLQERPLRGVWSHPSSVAFPGRVDGEPGTHRLTLPASPAGWRSTGLYVPSGRVVRIRCLGGDPPPGLVVQVGAWQDPHKHAHRVRLRTALRRFPFTERDCRVASGLGGPLYFDVPSGAKWDQPLKIEVRGVVQAPYYKHGVTTPRAWRNTIRHHQAPWAEFESDNLVFTVPSEAVRDVLHPDRIMEHWDRVHEAMQSLEPRTDNHWADRPYRYVADVSVSWGYMYCPADAPIVIPVKEAPAMFREENFDNEGANKLWGHYHEMGHAHQNPLWTDGATGEVTVNIFTVYALHAVNGYPLDSEVMRSTPAHAWQIYAGHKASGKPFPEVGGPFPRLQMYALLWHNFGFDAFHEAFDRLRDTPVDQRPRDDAGERNLFCLHFSQSVGHDLSGYFEDWGIPIREEIRAQLAALPEWRPTQP